MREIVLDTETTGLDPLAGHRVVEIGCVELLNHLPTGAKRQWYLNPDRVMPAEAEAVHGLSNAFLADKPRFADIVAGFLDFIGDSKLIIHNADFDMKFLNAELARIGMAGLPASCALDTVALARKRFPGAQASLDALCRRFAVDNSSRTVHGALLDCELLSAVYLELIGGRQPTLTLAADRTAALAAEVARPTRPPRPHAPTAEESAAHAAFVAKLKGALWTAE